MIDTIGVAALVILAISLLIMAWCVYIAVRDAGK